MWPCPGRAPGSFCHARGCVRVRAGCCGCGLAALAVSVVAIGVAIPSISRVRDCARPPVHGCGSGPG